MNNEYKKINYPVTIVNKNFEPLVKRSFIIEEITAKNLFETLKTIQGTYDLDVELLEEIETIKENSRYLSGLKPAHELEEKWRAVKDLTIKNRAIREAALIALQKFNEIVNSILIFQERILVKDKPRFKEIAEEQYKEYCQAFKIENPEELLDAWSEVKETIYRPIQNRFEEIKSFAKTKKEQATSKAEKELMKLKLQRISMQEKEAKDALILENTSTLKRRAKKLVKKEVKEYDKEITKLKTEGEVEIDF